MKSMHWRDFHRCFDAVAKKIRADDIKGDAEIQGALDGCTAGHILSDKDVLRVPANLVSFLEYLFHQAEGPYSPDFEWNAEVIRILFTSFPGLQNLINLNAADALANMVLNKRGRLKFLVSDQAELLIILEWWRRFGLIQLSSREVFDALIEKPTIKDRIESGDPLLIIRLLDVFPDYDKEVNPKGYDYETLMQAAGAVTGPPSERRYHRLYTTALKSGKDIYSLICEEERRILPMQMRRNRFLAYLVKNLHDNTCQVCSAMGEMTNGPVEVHHIVPLSMNGRDKAENMLTICPRHHRAVHAGEIILDKTNENIKISYSGETWTISVNHNRKKQHEIRT
ncbi:HNH endonuclease [Methanospirillum sp.]|uniref:HNH endonuclease n=1 Tax=Methanospirillum sp. TaxID=45200 RepID=UPI0035A01377